MIFHFLWSTSFKIYNESLSKPIKSFLFPCRHGKGKSARKEPKNYLPRIAEKTLETKLPSSGCVLRTEPKSCGKVTLSSRYAKSILFLKGPRTFHRISSDPKLALSGETPHLLMNGRKFLRSGIGSERILMRITNLENIF